MLGGRGEAASCQCQWFLPVGWCAVQPRADYVRLARMRVPWAGREEEIWGELCVGTPGMFEAAGMRVVSRPTLRRLVMRRELA